MTSEGNLTTDTYTDEAVRMTRDNKDFVIGFIGRKKIDNDSFVYMTPGVKLEKGGDGLELHNSEGSIGGWQ